jgi:23S rRNA (adenine2503-C2)-methyltransferase
VLRAWVQGRSLDTKRRRAEDFLPLALRNDLPGLFDELRGLARVHSEHAGEDGSARLLVELADGQTVESVLLPRDGLCVSTQVGCAVGCVFCMTGRAGLLRQLSSAEIVAQVVLARSRRTVKKVVFMTQLKGSVSSGLFVRVFDCGSARKLSRIENRKLRGHKLRGQVLQ